MCSFNNWILVPSSEFLVYSNLETFDLNLYLHFFYNCSEIQRFFIFEFFKGDTFITLFRVNIDYYSIKEELRFKLFTFDNYSPEIFIETLTKLRETLIALFRTLNMSDSHYALHFQSIFKLLYEINHFTKPLYSSILNRCLQLTVYIADFLLFFYKYKKNIPFSCL